ncbi:hypothetical protein [Paenibacillus barengoltzii]|jgi:serine/threonine protein kinase|uniref:hypothetical protein n=1 Tax=Paenibacillus barengoltzii TaxID=343517 RepID=UPI002FDA5884
MAERGYVAIDFYDGCVLYDFAAQKTILSNIDLYAKSPYINTMGRMWGSSRFMSPEEFTLGAVIDEVSNVYVMGATAFAQSCKMHLQMRRYLKHEHQGTLFTSNENIKESISIMILMVKL